MVDKRTREAELARLFVCKIDSLGPAVEHSSQDTRPFFLAIPIDFERGGRSNTQTHARCACELQYTHGMMQNHSTKTVYRKED